MAKAKKKKPVKVKKKKTKGARTAPIPARSAASEASGGMPDASPPAGVMTPIPNAGKKITDFEARLDEQINAHPKPQHGGSRPGSGRPTKPPPPPEVQPVPPAEITSAITQLLRTPFDLWAAKAKLPQLALSDEEADTITKPVQVLLDFYVPSMRSIDWAWISFAITGVAIMRPRVILLKELGPTAQQGSQRGANGTPPAAAVSPPLGPNHFPGTYKPQKL